MLRWYVLGENGTLIADDFEKPLRIRTTLGTVEADVSVPLVAGEWKQFYQNVADAMSGRAELAVQPEQLIPQIAIAEAAYRSIESQRVETVEWYSDSGWHAAAPVQLVLPAGAFPVLEPNGF